jgi:hypothetical protein
MLDLLSGFLREVADLEGGFWPTVRDLTIRPGVMLRRYLQGARRSYMHPGRYLLTAIVVATLVTQGLGTMGITTESGDADAGAGPAAAPDSASATAAPAPVDTSAVGYKLGYVLAEVAEGTGLKEDTGPVGEDGPTEASTERASLFSVLGNHYVRMVFGVTMALVLGLVYRRMFPGAFPRPAPALALALFVVAHVTLLLHAVTASVSVVQFFWMGTVAESGGNTLSLALLLLGNGVAAGTCFGADEGVWRAGLKGCVAAGIALLDTLAILIFILVAYEGGQSFWIPGAIPPSHPLFWFLAAALVLGVGVLFLPHLGLLLYRRIRPTGAGSR